MASVYIFQQGDGAPTDAAAAFCSGGTTIAIMVSKEMVPGGTPGVTAVRSVDTAAPTSSAITWYMESSRVQAATWPAGQWEIQVNVAIANANFTITDLFICRLDVTGVNQETVASVTGLGLGLGSTGLKTFTLTQSSDVSALLSDRIAVLVLCSVGSTGTQQVWFMPNGLVVSPIPLDIEATPAVVDVEVDHPAATDTMILTVTPGVVDVEVDVPAGLFGGLEATPGVVDIEVDHPAATDSMVLEVTPDVVDVDVDHPFATFDLPGTFGPGPAGQVLAGDSAAGQVIPVPTGAGQILSGDSAAGQVIPVPTGAGQILTGHSAAGQIIGGQ